LLLYFGFAPFGASSVLLFARSEQPAGFNRWSAIIGNVIAALVGLSRVCLVSAGTRFYVFALLLGLAHYRDYY